MVGSDVAAFHAVDPVRRADETQARASLAATLHPGFSGFWRKCIVATALGYVNGSHNWRRVHRSHG